LKRKSSTRSTRDAEPCDKRRRHATPTTNGESSKSKRTTPTRLRSTTTKSSSGHDGFVVPVLHMHVAEGVVNFGFWAGLAGTAALGAVELPVAAFIGAGVLVARHRRSH
jgi:hypothetical protein